MIYPQANQDLPQLKTVPNTNFDVTTSLSYEALWMNTSKAPLDDVNVRKALAYATDRDPIVTQLFGTVQSGIQPIQAFVTPANKPFQSNAFSVYKKDQSQVDKLMTGAGWAKGGDGIWAKGGQKASITVPRTSALAGFSRRPSGHP